MKSRVSSKGQVTIPVAVREALGLRPGTAVAFEMRPEGALLRRAVAERHPVDSVFGVLPLPGGSDALVRALRDGRLARAARGGRR